jgi:Zn-dependent protease with chaperone function
MQIDAKLFDGQSTHAEPITVDLSSGQGLRVFHSAEYSTFYEFADFDIEERLGRHAAILRLTDGTRIEIEDADAFYSQLPQVSRHSNFIYWLESRWILVVVAFVLAGIVVWASVTFGIPAVARVSAKLVPVEADMALGEQGLVLLDKSVLDPTELDSERRSELRELFADVVSTLGYADDDTKYRLELRQGTGIGANALALPSGIVVLTDELVGLAVNDDEIAAVLAHEVGHVRHRHTLRSIIQNSLTAGVIVAITGDVSSAASLAAGIPILLLERSYSRDFEREADEVAFLYLDAKGIEGEPISGLLIRIDEHYSGDEEGIDFPSILDTHPRSADRRR